MTVSNVAAEAGIDGAELFIDAAELTTDRKIKRAVNNYVVFGRVTPDQKRKLVRALKAKGHTVAMTGDGVNDVLALKDADCSIAMASGSEVAAQVSDIVLLDSDFAAMPSVVMEGRRVINNIERSAALFLVRNIFSFLLAITTMILVLPYPLSPSQLSLIGGLLIGFPSFVLALEPNHNLVRGKFLVNVLRSALPAGLTDTIALIALLLLTPYLGIPQDQMSTIAAIIVAFVGFLMLYKLCRPLNRLRITLIISMFIGVAGGGLLFNNLFGLTPLDGQNILYAILFCAACAPIMLILSKIIGGKK
jgi:cation-transporting ATPase E